MLRLSQGPAERNRRVCDCTRTADRTRLTSGKQSQDLIAKGTTTRNLCFTDPRVAKAEEHVTVACRSHAAASGAAP